MLEEIHVSFEDFAKEVIKGNTYEERNEILWRCYAPNPTKEVKYIVALSFIISTSYKYH